MAGHNLRLAIVPAALVLGVAVGVSAQAPTAPRFEVTSVKPTPPERQNSLRTDYCQSGGRFAVAGAPIIWSIAYSYRVKEFLIAGAPDWLNRFDAAYDIEGRPAGSVNEVQCRLMVQSLGEVRLNGGVQVNANGRPTWPDGLTMATLTSILANYTERPVVDRTGLQGSYGITLEFSLRDGDDRVSIFTAVQEQLGLKLEAGRARSKCSSSTT